MHTLTISVFALICFTSCQKKTEVAISPAEKQAIRQTIETALAQGIIATAEQDIEAYMAGMPEDLIILDESGEKITREMQRANVIRDWSIIDSTLRIHSSIDSINFLSPDSIWVYTSQLWERMMFRRDGITLDTVLTTQRHQETWKHNGTDWFGYEIVELGGAVFINGTPYNPG